MINVCINTPWEVLQRRCNTWIDVLDGNKILFDDKFVVVH